MEYTEEQFIEEVRNEPSLYDKTNYRYKDTPFKERIWRRIGEKFNIPDAKKKWNICFRDRYTREKRRFVLKAGQAATSTLAWYLMDNMKFLDAHLQGRPLRENVDSSSSQSLESSSDAVKMCACEPIPEIFTDNDALQVASLTPTNSSAQQQRKQTKKEEIEERLLQSLRTFEEKANSHETDDDDMLFLKAMHSDLKKMDGKKKIRFKIKMMQELNEALHGS